MPGIYLMTWGMMFQERLNTAFIAIVKEALHNIVRHSDASKVKIVMREHPALYQLIVEDNGTVKEPIQSGGVKTVIQGISVWTGYGTSQYERPRPDAWRNDANCKKRGISYFYYDSQGGSLK